MSIIPDFGSSPGPVNLTAGQTVGDFTLAEGDYAAASTIYWMYQSSSLGHFLNRGSIWYDVQPDGFTWSPDWDYSVGSGFSMENYGKVVIVIDLPSLPADQVKNALTFNDLRGDNSNSGQIFAISHNGDATVLRTFYQPTITNSGLLAAQAFNGWSALTIDFENGGHVINQAGGQILAEAYSATAIYYAGSGMIENAGLIEAASTSIVNSIGIRSTGTFTNTADIVNSGTIRADIAVYGDDDSGTTTRSMVVQHVTNSAGGLIDGRIELNNGDDSLVNRGTVNGDVSMGEGNDLVDTRGGVLNGIVDLFWGDDTFLGSEGDDRVIADDGNDRLEGNGGNDLLMGGGNDDTLIGGSGNDGLYGEYGNDRIVTLGGDWADGGAGNDRIELGDYLFAKAIGGQGFDTLVLPTGAKMLDLSAIIGSGRVAGFEDVDLNGSKELVVRPGDIAALGATGSTLRIEGSSTDKVDLVGAWTEGATQSIGGVVYRRFGASGATVLVKQAAAVAVLDSAPAGAVGLDPLGGGAVAPVPGPPTGVDYTQNGLYLYAYELSQPVVVNREETWLNDAGVPVLWTYSPQISVTNYGTILSQNDTPSGGTLALDGPNLDQLHNFGTVAAISTNTSGNYPGDLTTAVRGTYRIDNDGLIRAQAKYGDAVGIEFSQLSWLVNRGEITASTDNGVAVAVQGANHFENYGNIIAIGALGAVAAELIYADFRNDGYVQATTLNANGSRSIGLKLDFGHGWSSSVGFTNAGYVVADIAVQVNVGFTDPAAIFTLTNSGELHGDVVFSGSNGASLVNTGLIAGNVLFGAGNDVFDGALGTHAGLISGGDGNDKIIAGAGADTIQGGAGIDTLTGGAGNDTFLDDKAGHNGDTITDFSRGDRIVITDANLAGFTLTLAGDQLTYPGGSMSLANLHNASIQWSAAPEGGVQIIFSGPPIIISAGAPVSSALPTVAAKAPLGVSAELALTNTMDQSDSAGLNPANAHSNSHGSYDLEWTPWHQTPEVFAFL